MRIYMPSLAQFNDQEGKRHSLDEAGRVVRTVLCPLGARHEAGNVAYPARARFEQIQDLELAASLSMVPIQG
jgi:hypothetical protein